LGVAQLFRTRDRQRASRKLRIHQRRRGHRADIASIHERPFTRSERAGDDPLLAHAGIELQQHLHQEGGPQQRHAGKIADGGFDLSPPAQRSHTTHPGIGAHAGELHDAGHADGLGRGGKLRMELRHLGTERRREKRGFNTGQRLL
jgi:hypothetical protein